VTNYQRPGVLSEADIATLRAEFVRALAQAREEIQTETPEREGQQ